MTHLLRFVLIFLSGALAGVAVVHKIKPEFLGTSTLSPTLTHPVSNAPIPACSPTFESGVAPSSSDDEDPKIKCMELLGIHQVPLLPPPQFHASLPQEIVTNSEGEAYLKWDPVSGARSYYIVVETADGTGVRNYRTTHSILYLKGLPRAQEAKELYFVKIATMNGNEMLGAFGSKKKLWIRKLNDLTAPKIKEIRIED